MYKSTWQVRLLTLPTQKWWKKRIEKEERINLKWDVRYNSKFEQPLPSYDWEPKCCNTPCCSDADRWPNDYDRNLYFKPLYKPVPIPLMVPPQPKTRAFLYQSKPRNLYYCQNRYPEPECPYGLSGLKNYEYAWRYGLPSIRCPQPPGADNCERRTFYRKTNEGQWICPFV